MFPCMHRSYRGSHHRHPESMLEEDLSEKNVALIVIEGVGLDDFPWPYVSARTVENGVTTNPERPNT